MAIICRTTLTLQLREEVGGRYSFEWCTDTHGPGVVALSSGASTVHQVII